nr:MFS transporter [Candidatus Njordarchaeum guaymaensis]
MAIGVRSLTFAIYFRYLGFDAALIGVIFTVGAIAGAITAIPVGALADRWGRKNFLIFGRFLQVIAVLPLILSTDLASILIAMMLLNLGMSASSPPLNALLADKSPSETRNTSFSHNYIALAIGMSVGSAMSIFPDYLRDNVGLNVVQSYLPLFVILFLLTLVSLFIVALIHEVKIPRGLRPGKDRRVKRRTLTSADKILKYSLASALISLGAGIVIQLFSLWLNLAFGAEEKELAPIYVATNLSLVLGYFTANKLANLIGSVPSIVVTQAIATVLLVALPNVQSFELVGAIYVVRAMLMNMPSPIQTSLITGVVPINERASALGISNSASTIAGAAGPAIGGYLMENVSLSMPFYVCGSLYAASTAFFYTFFRKTKPQV